MTRTLIIEADGGSRGNPGPAAYGAVVRDGATHKVIIECAEFIGDTTNNVAEYSGLIAGLKAAKICDPTARVEVFMDSKLVVEQVSGRWKVKNEGLKPLHAEAQLLARELAAKLAWIPREKNKAADALANEAMDAKAEGKVWSTHRTPVDFDSALDRLMDSQPANKPAIPDSISRSTPSANSPADTASMSKLRIPEPDSGESVVCLIASGYHAAQRAALKAQFGAFAVREEISSIRSTPEACVHAFKQMVTDGRNATTVASMIPLGIAHVILRALGATHPDELAERLCIAPGTVTTLVVSDSGMPVVHHVAGMV